MPDTSYEADGPFAMPDSVSIKDRSWVELPSHRELDHVVAGWLSHTNGIESFRISGASGAGKTRWLRNFAEKWRESPPNHGPRLRWVVAKFGRGEPVTSESLVRQWSSSLLRWVERPSRYAHGTEARKWLDLAIEAQHAEGFVVVRAIESDRSRLHDDPTTGSMTSGILWLAREPFRGSRKNDKSIVLPVWSHDELALVLSRLHPTIDWPDSTVSEIWAKSSGRARQALKLASAFARQSTTFRNSA